MPELRLGPHVVLLGAGASRATCPNGDRRGRSLPLMGDLVDVLNLRSVLGPLGAIVDDENFETVYSKLGARRYAEIRQSVKQSVADYFSILELPRGSTIYDKLLLSLRRGDAVFTFNWDPFLYDAYMRNRGLVALPSIFFLHGNVRIGACPTHLERWGLRHLPCPDCGVPFRDVPLLYPVEKKGYSSSDPYIAASWRCAREFLREAFVVTIFGYSGPQSDREALDLLKSAWLARSDRKFEHVEVVDIAPKDDLWTRWTEFTPTSHLHVVKSYEQSFVGRWPRRSQENVFRAMAYGLPSANSPLANVSDLTELQTEVGEIAKDERGDGRGQECLDDSG